MHVVDMISELSMLVRVLLFPRPAMSCEGVVVAQYAMMMLLNEDN
jgi:hypothetical protein